MADTEAWDLGGPLVAAATHRVPMASSGASGGYMPLSAFAYQDASLRWGVTGPDPIFRITQTLGNAVLHGLELGGGGQVDAFFKSALLTGEVRIGAGRSIGWGGFLTFYTDTTEKLRLTAPGNLLPGYDNTQAFGSGGFRWSVLYAGSSTINTCDVRFKSFRVARNMADAEHAAALECFDAFGFFQFNDAIATKGTSGARWHFGPAAQEVWSIFADHGLADLLDENGLPPSGSVPPAFLCFDAWDGTEVRPLYSDTLVDEQGQPLRIGDQNVVTGSAGNIFGVRIDQLHSMMIVALNRERKALALALADLSARVAALEPAP